MINEIIVCEVGLWSLSFDGRWWVSTS